MLFRESENLELKESTAKLKEGIISISAILNKHQRGELYFGIKDNGTILGQTISDNTLREVSRELVAKDIFITTFKRKGKYMTAGNYSETTPQEKLSELKFKIISEIRRNIKVTRNQIANRLSLSPETVKEYLEKLKKKKLLGHVGSTKSGYWKILSKDRA